MNIRLKILAALVLGCGPAWGQSYVKGPDGLTPIPLMATTCWNGSASVTCSGGGGGGGGAVTAASGAFVDGAIATIGFQADTAWGGSGAGSEIGILKALYGALIAPLPAGSNAIGSVSVSNFPATQAISAASLPLPTGAATAAGLTTINATLGSPFQAGGSIGNTAFGISGTLPAFAATPTVNVGTLPAIPTGGNTIGSINVLGGNATAVKVDGSAVTQPVSVATLPALTAGSAVIGVTGVAQGSTTSGQSGELIQGAVTTGNPTYTTAQTAPISLTTSGAVRTIILGGNGGTSTAQTFSTASAANNAAIGISAIYNSTPLALTNGQSTGLQQDTTGALYSDTEGVKNTFSCSATVTLAATPTDIFSLVGSATKAVRLRSIRITTLATTAGSMTLQLAKRSTVDTSGTNTTPTVVPFDTNNAIAGTAVCKSWSANPTSGTLVGYIDTRLLSFPLTASQPPMDIAFGTIHGDSSLVLRGTSQELDVNLAGGTLPTGAALTITEEWTEE